MFDELVDDIVNRIDPAGHNTDELTKHYRLKLSILVNQEAEKRIAERMPSEEEMESEIDRSPIDMAFAGGFAECYEWLRSRLTTLGESQKTEGGRE